MYDDKEGRHYFIDEPAALNSGQLVIPVRWLEDESGAIWADVWEVETDERLVRTSSFSIREP